MNTSSASTLNKYLEPVLATWRNEANALRDNTHPERKGISPVMRMREEVTLRVCICDLSAALQAAAAATGRPITAIELGQLQALNRPDLDGPECPDLAEDSGERFDFGIGWHYARQKMKPAAQTPGLAELVQDEAADALNRFDAEQRRKERDRKAAALLTGAIREPKPFLIVRFKVAGLTGFIGNHEGTLITFDKNEAWAFASSMAATQAALNALNAGIMPITFEVQPL